MLKSNLFHGLLIMKIVMGCELLLLLTFLFMMLPREVKNRQKQSKIVSSLNSVGTTAEELVATGLLRSSVT